MSQQASVGGLRGPMARSSGYLPVEYTKLQGFDMARDHAGEQEGGRCNLSSTYPDAVTSWTESCANWLISMVPRGGLSVELDNISKIRYL